MLPVRISTLNPLATKAKGNPAFKSCYIKVCPKNVENSTALLSVVFYACPKIRKKGLFVQDV